MAGIRAGTPKDTSNLCFPRALRRSDPSPKRTPYAETAAPTGPTKSSAVLHHLVTTGSVKKALKSGKLHHFQPAKPMAARRTARHHGRNGEVMRSAHTPPKCCSENLSADCAAAARRE